MYQSFEPLYFSDETELRAPARIRRLFWGGAAGLLIAGVMMLAVGLAALALVLLAPIIGLMGLCCAGAGAAFLREAWRNPLGRYLWRPQGFAFAKGQLTDAHYLVQDRKGFIRARGRFGDNGLFMADFAARLWSNAIAEGGEEALGPGDDRYPQKGRRRRLPIDAWVLYASDEPRVGTLVGLPRPG